MNETLKEPKYKCWGYIPKKVYLGEYSLPENIKPFQVGKHYAMYETATGIYKFSRKAVEKA